jgi:hypothetical protein
MNKTLLACALAVASVAAVGTAQAATIIPVNMNVPGVGLNDPTPATPVGNNPGTTIGEQRQIVYQFAADLWGAVLESDVDIRVRAQFTALACEATSGVLGSAGARFIQRDFEGAVPATWYGEALANAIAGENLSPAEDEINSNFNANLGTPGCLENSGWYYGLDGNTPSGRINFLDVVMHEIGHGLNFQGFHNLTTGAPNAGFTDIYSSFVYDNATSKAWNAMTNAERVVAAKADALVWTGANVSAQVPDALGPLERLFITGGLTAQYDYGTAAFGAPATTANFSGQIVLVADGSANPSQGCVASPADAYAGKIALVDRGTCAFEIKANNAQNAGAIAVIVANNVEGVAGMAEDPTVNATVPTIMVSLSAGNAIKAALPNANAAIQTVPGSFAGSDTQGRARLYAPAVLATGSTFSHFDVSHAPNALMEPSINQDLDSNLRLDLTPALFTDLGWELNQGTATTRGGTCDTSVPVVVAPGITVGANLQAADAMCRETSGSAAGYRSCIAPFVSKARQIGFTPVRNKVALASCTSR